SLRCATACGRLYLSPFHEMTSQFLNARLLDTEFNQDGTFFNSAEKSQLEASQMVVQLIHQLEIHQLSKWIDNILLVRAASLACRRATAHTTFDVNNDIIH
ncbi:MAG: hypothetical protein EZS28_054132, partial [Streblomastix strix]